MLNVTGKYVTVFDPAIKPNISDKIVFANISTSKKNTKDGQLSYANMSWRARFVGEAFAPANELKSKDKINILRGAIENNYDKEKKTLFVEVIIFDFCLSNADNA